MATFTSLPAVSSFFTKVRVFLVDHEKLIVVVIGVALAWNVTGKIQDAIIAHDKAKLTAQQLVLEAQVNKNTVLAQQQVTATAAYQAQAAETAKLSATLERANLALLSALTKQQKTDATMTPTELVGRWTSLVPAVSGGMSVDAGLVQLTSAASHATVNELEKVPALQQQLANSQSEKTSNDKLLAAATDMNNSCTKRIDGLNLQIADADKSCKATVALVKAEAGRSKRKWFVVGYVAGLATRGAVKIFAGI